MLNKEILLELQDFVDNHLEYISYSLLESPKYIETEILQDIQTIEIEDFIKNNRKPTLQNVLFRFIDSLGKSDSDIYKKAGLDRKHFSKIRSNPNYRPRKNTIIALGLALELKEKEMDELLTSAGYSLSDSETFDLVIKFCIKKNIFDIDLVNQALDYFSLKPLIGATT